MSLNVQEQALIRFPAVVDAIMYYDCDKIQYGSLKIPSLRPVIFVSSQDFYVVLKDQNSLRNFTTAKDEKALGEVFESLRGALGQDASVQDEVFAWYRGRLKIITALHASIVTNLL